MKYLPPIVLIVLCCQVAAADVARTLPPTYTPPSQSDTVRIWGHPGLQDIVARWRDAYADSHPDVRFVLNLTGSDVAMAGLYTGRADLALLGRDATSSEIQAFEWVYQYKPSSVEILNGSVDMPGRSAALSVLVNQSNPLESLSMSQLDALFSHYPRHKANAITRWGQLGLAGTWRDAPVHLYSVDTETGTGRYFRRAALGGTRHLAWDRLREFTADAAPGDPASAIANRQLLKALALDGFGLAVAIVDRQVPGIKTVPLQPCERCEPLAASREAVGSGTYPLSRRIIAYFNRPVGQKTDPVLVDFVTFIRGPGQDLVEHEDGYVPLSPPAEQGRLTDCAYDLLTHPALQAAPVRPRPSAAGTCRPAVLRLVPPG